MVIGFYNHKGGTGKTTLCSHFLFRILEKNPDYKILAVDNDTQGNLSSWLSGNTWNGEIQFTLEEQGLDMVYCPQHKSLENIKNSYDLIVVDFAPRYDVTQQWYKFVDYWILPVDSHFAMKGAETVKELVSKVNGKIILVPNKYDNKYAISKKELKMIQEELNNPLQLSELVIYKPIHNTVSMRQAELDCKPIWQVRNGKRSNAYKDIIKFADNLIKLVNEREKVTW